MINNLLTAIHVFAKHILTLLSIDEILLLRYVMMLSRNVQVKVHSPDGDADFFNIVAGVLLGDTFAPYLFIIVLEYILRTSIDLIK